VRCCPGVAFGVYKGQGVLHLYSWSMEETKPTGPRREISAHEGGVNDLALTNLDGQLIAVSGGSDAEVKVWNASSGELMFRFTGAWVFGSGMRCTRMRLAACLMQCLLGVATICLVGAGHDAPVYSVCPHVKGNICFVFSTGRDGRIKAWLYDSQVPAVVDYSAPGESSSQ
jgi:WD40 repeat protein